MSSVLNKNLKNYLIKTFLQICCTISYIVLQEFCNLSTKDKTTLTTWISFNIATYKKATWNRSYLIWNTSCRGTTGSNLNQRLKIQDLYRWFKFELFYRNSSSFINFKVEKIWNQSFPFISYHWRCWSDIN